MGAHETINIVVIFLEHIQEARCKSTLAIVAMDYQLSDPTHDFILVHPTTGKHISGEIVIDSNSDVRACGVLGKVLRSKAVRTDLHTVSCSY